MFNIFSLHTHTGKSNASRGFADSSIKAKDLVKRAKEKGLNGIAITDHESVGSFIEGKNLEKEFDFPVLCGNEIYAVTDQQYDLLKNNYEKGMYFPHFLLLALDEIGNRQLRELSTIAWVDNSFVSNGLMRTPTKFSDLEKVIGEDKGHIVASSACLGGQISKWIVDYLQIPERLDFRQNQIKEYIEMCKDIFGYENFYLELQPPKEKNDMQDLVNNEIIKISHETNTEIIITTDAHYLDKDLLSLHCKFLNSGDSNDEDKERNIHEIYATAYLMSEEEVREIFNSVGFDGNEVERAIKNTDNIGFRAERYEMKKKQEVPRIKYNDNWTIDEKFFPNTGIFKKIIEGQSEEDKYLLYRIQEGMKTNTQFIDYQPTIERLEEELSEILAISEILNENLGAYFITMEKIIDIIWTEGDSIVGVGRGSCASSIIAFLLGIIQINPLKMPVEMPFWRFITRFRAELADIDIDTQSNRRTQIFNAVKKYFTEIGGEVVNCCTYGTIGAKSAIQTAGRGLGLSSDITQNLSSMIPMERGFVWSLHDTYYGNEDEGRTPVKEFVREVDAIEGLLDLALLIENVVISRGVHAAGVFITNRKFTDYNAKMLSPKGIITSQWDLHESEQYGLLKYDFLTTKACTKIRLTLDMLIENNHIEKKSTLKETYNSVIHPHVMNYDTPQVWNTIATNEMMDLFQFSTPIAMQTVSEIKPSNLIEMSQSNSLMRLQQQPDAVESPTHTYVRFKNDINKWYAEMTEYGVPKKDQEMLASVLLPYKGVAESQEALMILSQLEGLSKFTVEESHFLRKSIAKKSKKAYEEVTKLFYEKCKENRVAKETVDYVWNVQVKRQKLYSFSTLHSIVYSLIGLQELVLFTQYPKIYWNCACLTVNAGASDEDDSDKSTNYGKIASAIGDVMSQGTRLSLPHINEAKFGFYPNEDTDEIIFGLKGIVGIGDDVSNSIIEHRPYKSIIDFHERLVDTKIEVTLSTGKKQNKSIVPTGAVINLIKAGAFDKIEQKPREQIMRDYLLYTNPPKTTLNIKSLNQVVDLGIVPEVHNLAIRIYNFRNFLISKDKFVKVDENSKSKKWYKLVGDNEEQTEKIEDFFKEHFIGNLTEKKDFYYDEDYNLCVLTGASSNFEKTYESKIQNLKSWLNSPDCLDRFNEHKWNLLWESNASGSVSKWEMDSLSFYYHEHELINVDREKYSIGIFNKMRDVDTYTEEEKSKFAFSFYKGIKYPQYPLERLCGTVLDKNKDKHTISLLTPDGVVLVKYYGGNFSHYDKQISVLNEEDGSKTIVEKSWFSRGTKLLITGYRKGDQFKPKVYRGNIFQHTTCLIEDIRVDGVLELKTERTRI